MTKKKESFKSFKHRIAEIVREELKAVINEEVNPLLDRVWDKKEFAAWIVRQYFNPDKHGDQIWFNSKVTVDNVLDYISKANHHFPLTPKETAELWRLKGSLKKSMDLVSKDFEDEDDEEVEESEEGKTTYQTGDVSLKDIGQELGGLTPTMINKIGSSGMEKIRKLTGDIAPQDLDTEQWDTLLGAIKTTRQEVATNFANELKDSGGNILAFLQGLAKKQILTPNDLKLVTKTEFEGLEIIFPKDVEMIANILLQDLESDNNIFKSYQAAVSKKIFPGKKRGRPRKNRD